MDKEFTAIDARYMAIAAQIREGNGLLSRFFNWVKECSQYGWLNGNFLTNGEHFSDSQLDFIRDLGYHIVWNNAALWYEVNW